MAKRTLIIDTETYPNVFLLGGKELRSGKKFHMWLHEVGPEPFKDMIDDPNITLITFNGKWFDIPVIQAAAMGYTEAEIKELGNRLIEERLSPWDAEREYKLPRVFADHVDIIEVAPSFVGLKAYGARMNMPWLKELPFPHDQPLNNSQLEAVRLYCLNDIDTTEELLNRLKEPLALRADISKKYGIDVRSKSDSQAAEAVLVKTLGLRRGEPKIPSSVRYIAPNYVQFRSLELTQLVTRIEKTSLQVNPGTGHIIMPEFLHKVVEIGAGKYQMGVGGIHSTHDKSVCHIADDEYEITDIDVASFYPSIMIQGGMIPQNTGERFIEEYKKIYDRRLAAKKRAGELKKVMKTAEGAELQAAKNEFRVLDTESSSLKIFLNGIFGKTASKFSPLYSPDLMIGITLTGQLTLLALIEEFVHVGFDIISANTDGIVIRYRKVDRSLLEKLVNDFSERSGFEFEYTAYRVIALKDVNNYIAVTPDRRIKAKGLYAPPDLRKNPSASIVSRAVGEWLAQGKDLTSNIKSGRLVEYLSARNVTGGGMQNNVYLGKVVRWYMSTDRTLQPLVYAKNGNKVPKTDGARALMLIEDFETLPDDLDFNWYITEAVKTIKLLGAEAYLTETELNYDPPPPPKVRKSRKKKDA